MSDFFCKYRINSKIPYLTKTVIIWKESWGDQTALKAQYKGRIDAQLQVTDREAKYLYLDFAHMTQLQFWLASGYCLRNAEFEQLSIENNAKVGLLGPRLTSRLASLKNCLQQFHFHVQCVNLSL